VRLRASGSTLTAGELLEALEHLDDATPLLVDGLPVEAVDLIGGEVHLSVPVTPSCGACPW
jgi:hypothetical protein